MPISVKLKPVTVTAKGGKEGGKTPDKGHGGKTIKLGGGGTPQQSDPKYNLFHDQFANAVYDRKGKAAYKILSSAEAAYVERISKDFSLMYDMKDCLSGRWLRKCIALIKPYYPNIDNKGTDNRNFWQKCGDFLNKGVARLVSSNPNFVIAGVYNAASWFSWIKESTIKEHSQDNLEKLKEEGLMPMVNGEPTYIEDQGSRWKDIKYGSSNLDNAGCGIIAAYNTLVAMGESPDESDLVEIISEMEKSGAVFNGVAGTAPKAIKQYFKKRGHKVEMSYSTREKKLNRMGEEHTAFIALQLNDMDAITAGGHYISITKTEKNSAEIEREKEIGNHVSKYKFIPHNANAMKSEFPSLPQAVKNLADNPLVFCLMGIDKKVK